MQPTPLLPVNAGAVVEEVGGTWSRWIRPVGAALASLALLVSGVALWEYGRRAGAAARDLDDILFVATGVHLGGTEWLRRRTRRGDLTWRRALVLPGGPRPGLLGRRSKLALVIEAAAFTGIVGGGLLWSGARVDGWPGRITTALAAVLLPMCAWFVFKRLRHPTLVAVTSHGVVAEGQALPWVRIRSLRRDKEGVQLRVRDAEHGRWVTVGGPSCAVSNERLAHVIEYYRATPDRRIALDVNAPGPLGAVQ